MMYPPEHDPVWIDWKKATNGGLRFVAYVDEAGEPHIGIVELDAQGQQRGQVQYVPGACADYYWTGIFEIEEGRTVLMRFVAKATGGGLMVTARPLPSMPKDAERAIIFWLDDEPESSF